MTFWDATNATTQIWRVRAVSMEFLRSFLRRHFAGKPVVASRNVVCFLWLKFFNAMRYVLIDYEQ